ncbi:cation:proton antiporter [Candidatus Scalindua japonica]|nr:cation:proton antiporter [Candidatus Scalindua japonica]
MKNTITGASDLFSSWYRRLNFLVIITFILLFAGYSGTVWGGDHSSLSDQSPSGSSLVVVMVSAVLVLMILAAGVLAAAKRIKVPFAVALVFAGFAVAQLAPYGPDILQSFVGYKFTPEVFLYVFLPTLIFETAFNMDTRELRDNIFPITTLAIPGLLLSTAIIGLLISTLTHIELPAAMLLGAILSIIDHVAVGALLKQVGAPKRLMILMEGESLFSEVTLIVAAHILFGMAFAGHITSGSVLSGVVKFFIVSAGGISVGVLVALVTGFILSKVDDNPLIELSLIIVLAYMSFFILEHYFHVSGVLATASAGIIMGGWGRSKISPSVRKLLEEVWEYLAYLANAFIFLLLGLQINLPSLVKSLPVLVWVIPAMLLARGVIVYGLIPIVCRLPNTFKIDLRYQTVMYWGSMRGGIAIAMLLSLGAFKYTETFVAVITGVVLFTLLVQGLSIKKLVTMLGLDKPSLADRLAQLESVFSAKKHALARIPELRIGGLFSSSIADSLFTKCKSGMDDIQSELEGLRLEKLDKEREVQLIFFRSFAEEKTIYYEMFSKEHLTESAYRNLTYSIDIQIDVLRYQGTLPEVSLHFMREKRRERFLNGLLTSVLPLRFLSERLHATRTAMEYELVWGRYQASIRVLISLNKIIKHTPGRAEVIEEVCKTYYRWNESARERIDAIAEQFPEFVSSMQQRLSERMLIHAEREAIEEHERNGTLSHSVAKSILKRLAEEIHQLRGRVTGKLEVSPYELLNKVQFFQNVNKEGFAKIAERLRSCTVPAGNAIIRQGDTGDSMYFIVRGVVRTSFEDGDEERDMGTMMAGDFFGEIALLERCTRTATCRAVTPCALYELTRKDFEIIIATNPSIYAAVYKTGQERAAGLDNNSSKS